MTVNTENIYSGPYVGNDISDTFSYGFRIQDETQLNVYETDDAGNRVLLELTTDYTVTGVDDDLGGTIVRVAGALPSGYEIFIEADYPATQDTAFASQGRFNPKIHEDALDKLTFLIKQLQYALTNTVQFAPGYTGASPVLPDPEAGDLIRWTEDGIEGLTIGELLSEASAIISQLDMNGNQIKDLAAATAGTDAVNLTQVTQLLAQAGVDGVVPTVFPVQTGDGTTVTFSTPASGTTGAVASSFFVHIDTAYQTPNVHFTVDVVTGDLTFVSAPPEDSNIYITYFNPVAIENPDNALITATGTTTPRTLADRAANVVNVEDFASLVVVGDWTPAINAALDLWATRGGSTLYIPGGEFLYSGVGKIIDLQYKFNNKIVCDGEIVLGAAEGTSIRITNGNSIELQLNIRNGGVLGDFSNEVSVGGSTFLQCDAIRKGKIQIRSESYKGRVLLCTSSNNNRCIDMDIDIYTQGRTGAGRDRCGQAFYLTQAGSTVLGAFGKVSWRGEGNEYGPIFAYMNDLILPYIEAGEFVQSGMKFQGVRVCKAGILYIGETDVGTNKDSITIERFNGTGLQCSDFTIDTLRTLRGKNGLYIEDTANGLPIVIKSAVGSAMTGHIVRANKVDMLDIGTIGGNDIGGCLYTEGDSSNYVSAKINQTGAVTDDIVVISNDVERATISGVIDGGVAGKSLVKVIGNRSVSLDDLVLKSNVADQMIDIGFAGSNQIDQIGGKVIGTSTVYTAGRRPRSIVNVGGVVSESKGRATMLSGTDTVIVANPTISASPTVTTGIYSTELAGLYVSSSNINNLTFKVSSPVTADRLFDYSIDVTLLRG